MHPVEVLLIPIGRALRNRRADPATGLTTGAPFRAGDRFTLSSPSFADGEEIPARHCGLFIGRSVSPALEWDTLPAGTVDVLLVVEDLDNPAPTPRVHAVAAFAPIARGLTEGAIAAGNSAVRFFPGLQPHPGYAGPRPIPGHGTHRYRFQLYALDTTLDPTGIASADQLAAAVSGHVLGSAALTGTRTS